MDHIYPKSLFTRSKLKKEGVQEDALESLIARSNRLPNLQLLEGTINNEKRQKLPHEWYRQQWPDPIARENNMQSQAISHLEEDITRFDIFYDDRRKTLRARIGQKLGSSANE